jgi:hypothetical protein
MLNGDDFGIIPYSPPSYWSVVEVLATLTLDSKLSKNISTIRIGGRDDMHQPLRLPAVYYGSRFDQIDFLVYDALQEFNRHQDLINVFACLLAVLDGLELDLRGIESSFTRWKKKWKSEAGNEPAAEDFFTLNKIAIQKRSNELRKESPYINLARRLYRTLDFVERHELLPGETAEEYSTEASEWANVVQSGKNQRQILDHLSSSICRKITSALTASGLRYTRPKLEEVFLEDFPSKTVRLRFRANDFITMRSFSIWASIPLK